LNKINDLATIFTRESEHNLAFLMQSRKLEDDISFYVNKPFKSAIEVYPYDLPRELTKRRERFE